MSMPPVARRVGVEEIPWVRNPSFGAGMRLLQVDPGQGMSVMHGLLPAGMVAATHRHRGPVQMWTMSGSWVYREHGFVNRAGSYLYEPVDSVHTLFVPDDNVEETEVLSIVHGDVEYLDPDGGVAYVSTWERSLADYYAGCEEAGLTRPNGIIR